MKGRFIGGALLMTVGLTACDRIPFLGGRSKTAAVDTSQVSEPEAAPDSQSVQPEATPPAAQQPQPTPRQTPPQTRRAAPATATQTTMEAEVPWVPSASGSVSPGMTPEEVVQAWGAPVVERQVGQWTYMYFRNGCEVRCGTFDLVLFQGGQVVDAVTRTPAHTYTGISSSPAGTPGSFTPPQRFSSPIGASE